MRFEVEFSQLAADKYEKLADDVKERIARKLYRVAEQPRRFLRRLRGVDAFRIRVGDYRIIVDVNWEIHTIYVLTLGHRRTVYRG